MARSPPAGQHRNMVIDAMHDDDIRSACESAAAERGLGLRLGLAACPAAVIVTGHLVVQFAASRGQLDGGFVALLLADLLPVGIYVLGTRRSDTVMVRGYVLFTVVAGSWMLGWIEGGNQFAGMWVFLGWMVALTIAARGRVATAPARRPRARPLPPAAARRAAAEFWLSTGSG